MQVPGELVFTEKMVKGKTGGVQRLLRGHYSRERGRQRLMGRRTLKCESNMEPRALE